MKLLTASIASALLLAACASPAMDRDLSLHDRFVLLMLTSDDGEQIDELWKWARPLQVAYSGPAEYRDAVHAQALELGVIAGQSVEFVPWPIANISVEISDRDTPSTCRVDSYGRPTRFDAEIHIWSELPPDHIHRCIAQELGHVLGPIGDLDGIFGSRSDTVFASFGGASRITEQDRQVFEVLFDDRLQPGMPREQVLAILPEIVADVEAAQAAAR